MTERKTRDEIVMKLPEHTAAAVVNALDAIERKWGDMFKQVFKTITMDNGSNLQTVKELNVQHWEQAAGQRHIIVIHTAATKEEATK